MLQNLRPLANFTIPSFPPFSINRSFTHSLLHFYCTQFRTYRLLSVAAFLSRELLKRLLVIPAVSSKGILADAGASDPRN
ncbi:unnamed protein product [Zymoseptoria tritici ST99CH_1A5]|uniref:Uncharacterized protein n=3 Tax=Zymoseptoria tritici TaxID=1047171 RepID=A0A1X7RJJ8_ZYMT9|nr:unnamed protein product [Zymoseptoria tritici ST99CH_3D7]SMR46129.1 unnamed protein product [Zymoseptoria tritici ST99CH_1E4]SMR47381.1 unnamed protein product [Zymoseptoria tritici ST99CH_3D1]SMY21280.1 unnamed protein product [Zymoseptoria tritici ST99CH_1A5]